MSEPHNISYGDGKEIQLIDRLVWQSSWSSSSVNLQIDIWSIRLTMPQAPPTKPVQKDDSQWTIVYEMIRHATSSEHQSR